MIHLLAANAILTLHLLFICLVMFGAVVALRWPGFAFIHIPAAIWGFLVEAMGWYCPLTEFENALLRMAGEEGYTGGFIEHYLLAIIYPDGLTREIQVAMAVMVLLVNGGLYGWMLARRWRQKRIQSDA
jgi:hypothetical protein